MLKQLRNKKLAKKIWIALAVIIVPAFVFWGFGGAFRSKEETAPAGKIAGLNVSFLDFKEAIEAVRNQAIMQLGDNFQEVQKNLNLENMAWERLVLLAEARRRKITASDQEVVALVQQYPFFRTQEGPFDNRLYTEILQYVFHTPARQFEEQTRQNLILSKLFNQVSAGVKLNDEEVKLEYQKANDLLNLQYIAASLTEFKTGIPPKIEEIKGYFDKHSLEFKQPLSFNIEYIALDSQEKLQNVTQHLKKNTDLKKIAAELGIEAKVTGLFREFDPIPGIGWAPQVIQVISKLKPGEYSPVFKLDKTFLLLRLKERKEPYIPEFEAVKDKVRETLIKEEANRRALEKIEGAFSALKENRLLDFTKIAKEFGLKSGFTGDFKFGSYIEGIGASDTFWNAAGGLEEKAFSPIIEMPSGFYIIKVKSRNTFDEKKFSAEKEAFTRRLLLEQQQGYFIEFVSELKRKTLTTAN